MFCLYTFSGRYRNHMPDRELDKEARHEEIAATRQARFNMREAETAMINRKFPKPAYACAALTGAAAGTRGHAQRR